MKLPWTQSKGKIPRRESTPLVASRSETTRKFFVFCGRITMGVVLGLVIVVLFFRIREFLYSSNYFRVRTVQIEGVSDIVEGKIRTYLDSKDVSANLLAISLEDLQKGLMAIPEVREVSVTRHLPDVLRITGRERHPILILVGEENYLVDTDLVSMGTLDGKAFVDSHLPIVTIDPLPAFDLGESIDDSRLVCAWEMISELQKKSPLLAVHVAETHVDGDGNISFYFEGGTEIRLGRRSPSRALPILEAFWKETDGMNNVEYANLQYRNQVTLKKRGSTNGGDNPGDGKSH